MNGLCPFKWLFVHLVCANVSLFLNFLNFQVMRIKLAQLTSHFVIRTESQGDSGNILKH